MKIKNEYVKVKIGNKTTTFNNMILDTYLRYMAETQSYFENEYWQSPFLAGCYIKFDRKLEFDETSILSTEDFDIRVPMINNYMTTSSNKNEIEYLYKIKNNYTDKKITAIGFFDNYGDVCFACLDLSDYSLKIKNNEDITIVRKDILSTEANFVASSPKIKYPLHLSPFVLDWNESNPKTTQEYPYFNGTASAHLDSVGLGINKIQMSKEIQLTEDSVEFLGEKIIFRNIFSNENLVGILEPNFRYPSNNLYPSDTGNSFTYIFLKYKLYYNIYDRQGSFNYKHVDTGEWYTLSIPFRATGNFDYAIEYERSDNNGI